jgi:hypothetical protein
MAGEHFDVIEYSDSAADQLERLVTVKAAGDVLWHFTGTARGAVEPGSFVQKLVECIAAADPWNQANLALGFPAHVAAVQLAQGRQDGLDRLSAVRTAG